MSSYQAILVRQVDGRCEARLEDLPREELPPGDVLIEVEYSSLNYKDALAVTGRGKILRKFPLVPGIDLAGRVVESDAAQFKPGDEVLVTGWGLGETRHGGFAQLARVSSDWVVPMPDGLTAYPAMAMGTAGLTAMLSVMALEDLGLTKDRGQIVVTGAGGGVGGISVLLLAELGYPVAVVTGRTDETDYFTQLGAEAILPREELTSAAEKPLASERWGGGIDTVGGPMLAGLLAGLKRGASVACCGLAGGHELHTTVFPFILRGAALLGIDSAECPQSRRIAAWRRLAETFPWEKMELLVGVAPRSQVALADVIDASEQLLAGKIRGRTVVRVSD